MNTYNLTLIPIIFLTFLLISCSGEQRSESERVDDGSQEYIVETAVFADLDGNDVSIEEFRGSLVLIDFWESWCGPCLQVFPSLEQLRGEYPEEFQVLAVTVGMTEGPEEARAFAEEYGYDFHFLYDEYGVFEKLGGQGIPYKVYVDPDGKFIKIEMGSYGREGDYNRAKEMITTYFND